MQTSGLNRNPIDQFYTKPEIAALCISKLQKYCNHEIWIEPSAGTGVFLDLVPDAIGYDIDPKSSNIIKKDFLTIELPENCVVFGNPPFGRQSSTAKKFIRHAAQKAYVIAFILPKSFMKPSMQLCFPLEFHLKESTELPINSFLLNGESYDVPCVFQVWRREADARIIQDPIQPVGFCFVKSTDIHNLVIRRVGVNAGKCFHPNSQSPQSHYFIQIQDESTIENILECSNTWTIPSNTVGPKSLSKSEICKLLHSSMSLSNSR